MSKMSRRIVIDASVARAAGETEHPISQRCRLFLLDVLTIGHRVVMSEDIIREWNKHASRYSIKWLRSMRSHGKVIKVTPDASDLFERILAADWSVKDIAAMEKDMLLPLAALAADRLVASGDNRVRDRFAMAASGVGELGGITWVNPATAADHCGPWLHAGARHDDEQTLGALHTARQSADLV
jgi:hypothetical protein